MMFILFLIALVAVRFSAHRHLSLPMDRAGRWYRWVEESVYFRSLGGLRLYLGLAAPVIAAIVLLVLLHGLGWVFPAYLVSFALLLFSFGASVDKDSISAYLEDLLRDDVQAAYHDASAFADSPSPVEADNWKQLHRETLKAIASRYFESYFPVILWFLVLGAPGALFYRLLRLTHQVASDEDRVRVERMLRALEWVPLRVLGLTFALVGNFGPVASRWRRSLLDYRSATTDVLLEYVILAIYGKRGRYYAKDIPAMEVYELQELSSLIDRALITWVAAVGLMVVAY